MGYLVDDQDTREPDIWAAIGLILALITVALLIGFLTGCATAGPAVVHERGRPVTLMHFEIKLEGGRTLQDVKTWSYADEDEPDNPADPPVRR